MANIQNRTCPKCNLQAETDSNICPRCHGKTFTQFSERIRGLIAVILGVFLIFIMASLIFWAKGVIDHGNDASSVQRFNGTNKQSFMMFALFGTVLMLGLFSVTNGMWQLVFGRTNRVIKWSILAIGLVLLIGVTLIMFSY